MSNFVVRGIHKEELVKLDRLAKERKVSREEYVRRVLRQHLMSQDIKNIENKYENLVEVMLDVIQNNTEQIERMMELLERGNQND